VSTPLQASVFSSYLLNVLLQLANKNGIKKNYDRQSVGQSVLVSGAHMGPVNNFSFAMKFPVDSCGFGGL
jgi:hypothetical protein